MPTKRKDANNTLQKIQSHLSSSIANDDDINYLMKCYVETIGTSIAQFRSDLLNWNIEIEERIMSEWKGNSNSIPKVIHRTWITSECNPDYPPQEYIDDILRDIDAVCFDCINYFWSNSDEVLHFLREIFSDKSAVILFENIKALATDDLYRSVDILISEKKYVFSTDLLRVMFVRKFGGIYADLGISFSRELLDLAFVSDHLCLYGSQTFLQTSLLGSTANSDMINLYHAVLCNPNIFPIDWIGDYGNMDGRGEVNTLAGPGFTALLHLFKKSEWRVLIVREDGDMLKWRSHASWYGHKPKFGNALVEHTPPSFLSKEELVRNQTKVNQCVIDFGLPKKLLYKLKLLVGLTDYFQNHPTRLCEIMYFNQSDKALSWHNYTFIYNYMLSLPRDQAKSLLEIGIGTNHLDVPSSMGATGVPGASLRGWREFFDVHVYGADIDRRILFKDRGIDTFFVDQLDPGTISDLFDRVTVQPSIVIDDGLHTFEANINVLNGVMPANSVETFVVEDILNSDVHGWLDYLQGAGVPSALVRIPSELNKSDNNLMYAELPR